VAERCPEPGGQKRIAVDRALMDHDAQRLRDVALSLRNTAKPHKAAPRDRLRTVAGSGELLCLVLLDESHDIQRVPRGHDVVSSCRLVTCAQVSAGKRSGTSGTTIGHASLSWAFAEAAVLCLRTTPAGQTSLARVEKQHGKGKALTVLAHKLARAVSQMLHRETAFDRQRLLHSEQGAARVSLQSH
jgi:transposase